MRAACHVRITGRVQGVGFRAWTRGRAEALGLRGWVRNEPDGAVTVLIAGDEVPLAEMIDALNTGPAFARVDHVSVEPAAAVEINSGFQIIR
jgi:acylphosphatase